MTRKTTAYYSACVAFVCIIIYLFYIRFRLIFSYSIDLDGCEFTFIYFTQLIDQGKLLYRNPLEFPFMAVQHTPAYPYLLYCIYRLMKLDFLNDIHQMMVIARLLAWLSMLINIYFIVKIFKLLKMNLFYILGGVTVYILLITGHFYATRPDAIRTTLFTIFFYHVFKYIFFDRGHKHLFFSVFFCVAIIFFKHDSIVNIYILLLLSCVYLGNKRAYYLISLSTICLFISVLGCYFIFGINFFINIIIFNLQVLTDVLHSFNIWMVLLSVIRNFPLLILAVYGSIYAIKIFKEKAIKYFIPLLAVTYFLFAHLSMLRAGSYLNYTYDMILLLVLNACLLIKESENYFLKHLKIFSGFAIVYLLSIGITNWLIHSYTFNADLEAALKNDYYTTLREREQILSITKNDIFFVLNYRYPVFFAKGSLMWGYEMNFDKMLEVFLNIKQKSKQLFVSTYEYDSFFANGRVKYIVAENNKINFNYMKRNYPNYTFYKSFTKFRMYKYSAQAL